VIKDNYDLTRRIDKIIFHPPNHLEIQVNGLTTLSTVYIS
jgi:hypothetical protein